MTNEEPKKKILSIVRGAILEADELPFVETTEYVADALIAAGYGDVNKFADTLVSKIPCHSYYYGNSIVCAIYALKQGVEIKDVKPVNISEFLVDELRRKLKEAEHRAQVAEKAGRIIQRDMARVFDVSNPRVRELTANIWNLAKKQAEKELAEEKKDEN